MKKILAILSLTAVIALVFGYTILKWGSLGADDNWFNSHWRVSLARYPLAREAFSLHHDGDGRGDYLLPDRSKIIIEVDRLANKELSTGVIDMIRPPIEKVTGKNLEIIYSSELSVRPSSFTPEEMRGLAARSKSYVADSSQAVFYLLLLGSNSNDASMIGTTVNEDGAVLFLDAMADLKSLEMPELQASTILHEFGHQLGLPHNNQVGCIMNPELELGGIADNIVTKFCGLEQRQLIQIKKSLQ